MAYETTASIVSQAARELGLVSADIADPFGATDPNILQLLPLLNSLGRTLVSEFHWSQFQQSYTFATVVGQESYSLPADFGREIDGSGWNRSTKFPTGGPVSPEDWQYLKALTSALSFTTLFRKQNGKLLLYPTPSSVQTIAYEYISDSWVAPTGAPTVPAANKSTLATDVLFFDAELIVCGLKLRFKREKGFDYTAAAEDFNLRLEQAKSQDPAPALNLAGGRPFAPLLDGRNLPPTGWGT